MLYLDTDYVLFSILINNIINTLARIYMTNDLHKYVVIFFRDWMNNIKSLLSLYALIVFSNFLMPSC
jgi:hypothetical protein